MAATNMNIRIDSDTKAQAQKLFASLGLDLSTAVNIFIRQSLDFGGIPFVIKQTRFNSETEAAMQEARDIESGKIEAKSYSSAKELFEELDNEC